MDSAGTVRWLCMAGMVSAVGAAVQGAEKMDGIIAPGTKAEVLGSGYGFSEGPAADADGNVYFSDGRTDSIHFYEVGRGVRLFVNDSLDANGMMFNRKGELVVCEGAAYRVVAFDVDTKKKRVLVGAGERRFNEPNDLAIDCHDGFYFTDPNYKHRGQELLKKEDVYYCSPEGNVTRVSTVCEKPNGILLTPDGKTLYLADNKGAVMYRYDVTAPGELANEKRWIELGAGPDGMTLDEGGNVYVACGRAGVKVYSADGEPVGAIGETYGVPHASNCCFGGKDFSTLYMTSRDKFLGIKTKVRGVKPLPLSK